MPKRPTSPRYVAFYAGKRIAEGSEPEIAALLDQQKLTANSPDLPHSMPLVFDIDSGAQIELPVNASSIPSEAGAPARPGRPKLGVIAREVTLLPKDWDWLNVQSGGASVTLRKLVLMARRSNEGAGKVRQAQISCYRFISAIAGDEPGYEEASRGLFTGDAARFEANTQGWPADVRDHARKLANAAFESDNNTSTEKQTPL